MRMAEDDRRLGADRTSRRGLAVSGPCCLVIIEGPTQQGLDLSLFSVLEARLETLDRAPPFYETGHAFCLHGRLLIGHSRDDHVAYIVERDGKTAIAREIGRA